MGLTAYTIRAIADGAQAKAAGDAAQAAEQAAAAEQARQERADRIAAEQLPARLDEARRLITRYVCATPCQIDAMVLVAAHSHVLDALVTTCRVLFCSERPASGKTVAMLVLASLCYNATDTTGTQYALQSALAAAAMAGDPVPTLYRDEISSVFGTSGLGGRTSPLADIIRKGYKKDAKSMWSVQRTADPFSIYSLFLMAGLRTAVPADIRTRCIVLEMAQGIPLEYFDAREAEAEATVLMRSLASAVRGNREKIAGFRARSLTQVRGLSGRRLEVWEGCLAVAHAASQEWLNRAVAAFRELALDGEDTIELSPDQMVVRDLAAAAERITLLNWQGSPFAPGLALIDALKRIDPDRYAGRADSWLGNRMRDALQSLTPPVKSRRVRVGKVTPRGYLAEELTEAWERIRPDDPLDVSVHEDPNPFADDADSEVVPSPKREAARS